MDLNFLRDNSVLLLEAALIAGIGWNIKGLISMQRAVERLESKLDALSEAHKEDEASRRTMWKIINKIRIVVSRLCEREGIEADLN